MRNFIILLLAVIILLAGASWWSKSLQSGNPDLVARDGIHWHPELTIFIKGEKQEIPANIGIGAIHQPIHTHDATGVIHLEFDGVVHQSDITLGQFFRNWGKDLNSFGLNVKMTVNDVANTELGNYVMHDKDKIELRYE